MVLEEEGLVDAIFLESTELDDEADSTSQRLFDDKILLAANLGRHEWAVWRWDVMVDAHAFEK